MFGFTGSHRSGKSTLAKRIAGDLGVHYYEASFGRMAKELGYDAVSDMSAAERMTMQEAVLAYYEKGLNELPRPCVTDRTPLDMMAYMLAEIGMHAGTDPELAARIVAYRENCLRITRTYFNTLISCRPLPAYVMEAGKPPENAAFQWHIQTLIEGGMNMVDSFVQTAYLNAIDLDARAEASGQLIATRIQMMEAAKDQAKASKSLH